MASPIKRASHRVFEFMDAVKPEAFTHDGEMFEYAYACAIEAVREEYAKDARARRRRATNREVGSSEA